MAELAHDVDEDDPSGGTFVEEVSNWVVTLLSPEPSETAIALHQPHEKGQR